MQTTLVLQDGGDQTTFRLAGPEIVLGSAPDCPIRVEKPGVAARHCAFRRLGDQYVVADLAGGAGTFLNGERIKLPAPVAAGDKVSVGPLVFEVRVAEDPELLAAKRLLHRQYAALPDFSPAEYKEWDPRELRRRVSERLDRIVAGLGGQVHPAVDVARATEEVLDELSSLGPLTRLMKEEGVSEVMINGPSSIYVEKGGKIFRTRNLSFASDEHVVAVARQILGPLGKTISDKRPLVDARTSDGSRVNVVIPPAATTGPTITIRRFSPIPYKVDDLVRFGSLSPNMARFLETCVRERVNVLVAGGTGSGKTTLLNVLSTFIPERERIVTIEDSAELKLDQEHVVSLEARHAGLGGAEESVTIRDLVKNSLRMRPDRIVVGEVRGAEALDMLQAMNTGHDGSLSTIHANSPRDVLSRLETLVLMAELQLPSLAIRQQIASAIQLIVHQARFADGSRKVVNIFEITGIQNDVILMQDIFFYKHEGYDAQGKARGRFGCRGMVPKLAHQLREHGVPLDLAMFAQAAIDKPEAQRAP